MIDEIKNKIKSFSYIEDIEKYWGVTLTLKQSLDNKRLDRITSSQNFKHFMNVLNRKIFKNSYKRYDKRLSVVPYIEDSINDRIHYHITIENPYPLDPDKFESLLRQTWVQTRWSYKQIHIERNIDNGWIDYCGKGSNENIDWVNYSKVS